MRVCQIIKFSLFLSLFLLIEIASLDNANATATFSRKYDAPCSLCHQGSIPSLNRHGEKFKLNGYQLVKGKDGNSTQKRDFRNGTYVDHLRYLPLSIALRSGVSIYGRKSRPDKELQSEFLCCTDGIDAKIMATGTLDEDVGYNISFPLLGEEPVVGYARITNFFKPGLVSLDIGAMRILDYDSEIYSYSSFQHLREIGNTATEYNRFGKYGVANKLYSDTGIRIYGNPSYGKFTYELGYYTGSGLSTKAFDDGRYSYTIMGRADFTDTISASVRYYNNNSSIYERTYYNSKDERVIIESADDSTKEETHEVIFHANYGTDQLFIDLAFDWLYLYTKEDKNDKGDTVSSDEITRLGLTTGAYWRVSSWLMTGASYSFSNVNAREYTLNGEKIKEPDYFYNMLRLMIETNPTATMRIALEGSIDFTSKDSRRKLANRSSGFPEQYGLGLYWNFSF